MGLFSSIIGAVAGPLIGGIFGKKKSQTTRSTVDYQQMVASAEAAGINPLTALRNGGAAGFAVTHHPAMASSSFVSDALSSGLQSAFSYDARAEENAQLETELMKAQLERINQTNSYYAGMEPPSATAPSFRTGGGELSNRKAPKVEVSEGHAVKPLLIQSETTNPTAPIFDMQRPPWMGAGAEGWEQEFGELGELFGSMNNVADYATWNLVGRPFEKYVRPALKQWSKGFNPKARYKIFPTKGNQ